MVLVLLDDAGSVVIGVERVHENEGDVDVELLVEVLDLAHRQVEEGHALAHLDDRLGSNTAHGSTETTIELEDGKLVEDRGVDAIEDLVGADLFRLGRLDLFPVASGSVNAPYTNGGVAHIFSPLAFSVR